MQPRWHCRDLKAFFHPKISGNEGKDKWTNPDSPATQNLPSWLLVLFYTFDGILENLLARIRLRRGIYLISKGSVVAIKLTRLTLTGIVWKSSRHPAHLFALPVIPFADSFASASSCFRLPPAGDSERKQARKRHMLSDQGQQCQVRAAPWRSASVVLMRHLTPLLLQGYAV